MTTLKTINNVEVDQNGNATIRLTPTQDLVGTHIIRATYNQNNNYNTGTGQANITVNKNYITIDCTSTDSWVRNNDRVTTTALLDDDGYITSVREGNSDYFTVCQDLLLQRGMIIEVTLINRGSGNLGYGFRQNLPGAPSSFFIFCDTLEETHSGNSKETRIIGALPGGNSNKITYHIDNEGYITTTDEYGDTYTSQTAYTDTELALMQFVWKQWDTDKTFSVHELRYKITGEEYSIISTLDACDSLENWKSTSGTTYPPSIVTQDGFTGVKAPQGQNRMSFHMSYVDIPLRLDTFTIVSCDIYLANRGISSKYGIFTPNYTETDHQYRSAGCIQNNNNNITRLENYDGTETTLSNMKVGEWIRAYFIIDGERGITVMTEDENGDVCTGSTLVADYDTSDDTLNNQVFFGIQSAYRSYPLLAVRNVLIHQYNTSPYRSKSIGLNTDTAWTTNMIRGGGIDNGALMTNYTCNPMIINSIPLKGNFKLELEIKTDYLGNYGHFGLTTSNDNISTELKVNNNNINDTTSIQDVFTEAHKVEKITIKRIGNTYTYTQNGNTYTVVIVNPSDIVYVYVNKNGNGSFFINTMKYTYL